MENADNSFKCSMCFFQASHYEMFCNHVVRWHRHDQNFVVNCGFGACSFVTKSWSVYKMHVCRKHKASKAAMTVTPCDLLADADVQNCIIESFGESADSVVSHKPPPQVMLCASYLLSLETEHKMSQNGINDVIQTTEELLSQQILCCKQQIVQKFAELGVPPDAEILNCVMSGGFFEGLKTTHQRRNFYQKHCNFIEPHSVYLGKRMVKCKGRIACVKRFGEIIPFQSNLTALLSLPDVWYCVQNSHASSDNMMHVMVSMLESMLFFHKILNHYKLFCTQMTLKLIPLVLMLKSTN
jgi:hypothetical protein